MELTIGYFLTFISIIVATVSMSFATNKRLWVYRFNTGIKIMYAFLVILILYFLFFDILEANGVYFKFLMIDTKRVPTPAAWASIFALVTLFSFIWIMFKGKIRRSNYDAVISYYKTLIEDNPSQLIEYLRLYHLKDILKHIDSSNKKFAEYEKKDPIECLQDDSLKTSTPSLEGRILSEIVFDNRFIDAIIKSSPMFFLEITNGIDNLRYANFEDATNYYYTQLIRSSCSYVVEGLNNTINFCEEKDIAYRLSDSKFAQLAFSNLDFTIKSRLPFAFGEEALRDVDHNEDFYQRQCSEYYDEQYKKNSGYLGLRCFDILVRNLLVYKVSTKADPRDIHFYPYYFLILQHLQENYTIFVDDQANYASKLFWEYVDNIQNWIICYAKSNEQGYGEQMLKFLFSMVMEFSSNKENINIELWTRLLTMVFSIQETVAMAGLKDSTYDKMIYDFLVTKINGSKNHKVAAEIAWQSVDRIKYMEGFNYYEEINELLRIKPTPEFPADVPSSHEEEEKEDNKMNVSDSFMAKEESLIKVFLHSLKVFFGLN